MIFPGHGVFGGIAYQAFFVAHFIHDFVTDIDAGCAADALVLQAIANIDTGRADLHTQRAVDAVAQADLPVGRRCVFVIRAGRRVLRHRR